ncbi:hypothetical protein [Christiangramia echinicola]|uniref:hypothetical protein n=1 Tax=Christiangramia echinicola TaxID=279359 RepID=UPI0004175BAF|nr:hypothetical protein [Christiangramia echinicola]
MLKYILFLSVILLVAADNNGIEALIDKGYSTGIIMLYRGLGALLVFMLFAIYRKSDLKPKRWKPHIFRLIINGLSAWFLIYSFKFLSAGTVALFQRMKLPLLILIAVFSKNHRSSLQFYLSIWTIFIIIFFVLSANIIDEDPKGFLFIGASIVLSAISFFIIKKQSETEGGMSLGVLYLGGIVLWGLGITSYRGAGFEVAFNDLWLFVLSGGLLALISICSIILFKRYNAEKVRLPFALGALATLGLEMILENKIFTTSHIGLSVLLIGIMITICLNPSDPVKISK